MELRDMIDDLPLLGLRADQKKTAAELYESGQTGELIRYLRRFRCGLVEDMHESQRKVDRIDQMIRRAEKELQSSGE